MSLVEKPDDGIDHGEDVMDNNEENVTNSIRRKRSKKAAFSSDAEQKELLKKDGSIEYELVPPDGGWGWLVLFGSMLVNILVPGTIKSFGVLFVEFIEAFEATPATAAWIPALCYFLYSSLGPLSSILSVKYSYRTVTLIGGTFAAVGMIMSFWASSVTYLYISYGVFVGTGAGLSFPPTVYIVTSYFVKLRGLANGLCISGSALGSIILPPVLRFLLETYGYRGACLIMGGLTLNVWVAALFYQPVEQHLKRVPKRTQEDANELAEIKEEEEELGIVLQFKDKQDDIDPDSKVEQTTETRAKFAINSSNSPYTSPKAMSPDLMKLPNQNGFARSASAVVVQNYGKKVSKGVDPFISELSSTPSLYVTGDSRYSSSKLSRLTQFKNNERTPKRSPSTSSFQFVSTPYHGSTLSAIQPEVLASHLSLRSQSSKTRVEPPNGDEPEKTGLSKFFDLSLLKDPMYLVILISNSTNAIGYTNFIILLPSYAITLGFDKSLAAYLLSIVSALDLVGRIGGSALSDWTNFIPKTWYFVGGLAVSGASLAVLPMVGSYSMVSLLCAIFGLASGIYVGITAVIMADMLGLERLTSSYGISLFVNGILQLVGPPLCGLWFEAVQSYAPLYTTLGIILLAGASLWFLMPFIRRRRKRRENSQESQDVYNVE